MLDPQSDVAPLPPVYIFIVDTAISEDELDACKSTLEQALQMMPEDCLIGALPDIDLTACSAPVFCGSACRTFLHP